MLSLVLWAGEPVSRFFFHNSSQYSSRNNCNIRRVMIFHLISFSDPAIKISSSMNDDHHPVYIDDDKSAGLKFHFYHRPENELRSFYKPNGEWIFHRGNVIDSREFIWAKCIRQFS